jgi:two-component system, OmpR family, response regulator
VTLPELRLLVVDDDPLQLELVQRALGYEGFLVETTSDLASATAAVERFGPDLVLVDVNIPGMSGEDLRGFVASGQTRARVFLFSASDGSQLKSLAAKLGAHGWLSKSSALPEIARRLRELHASGTPAG